MTIKKIAKWISIIFIPITLVFVSCQSVLKNEAPPAVYKSASFKTWLLGNSLPFWYTPNRIRSPHPRTGSLLYGLERDKSAAEDINVFAEKIDIKRVAGMCYSGPGKIYFIPGQRISYERYGLTAGVIPFEAFQPVRFLTESDIDLSVIATNVFLLYQLYLDGLVEPIDLNGKWWFRWSEYAYAQWSHKRSLSELPQELHIQYPIVSAIETPKGFSGIPSIPYGVKMTDEVLSANLDELRGQEGTYYGSADVPYAFARNALDVRSVPVTSEDARHVDSCYAIYINKMMEKTSAQRIKRMELWVVRPDTYFQCMKQDPCLDPKSSVVRYEYFSCHTSIELYYKDLMEYYSETQQRYTHRSAILIYDK